MTVICLLLTGAAQASNPIALFDGKSMAGWTTQNGNDVTRGWTVTDGMMHLDRSQGRGGHILSQRVINGDFELRFDWKIAKGGNSGLKYRVRKYGQQLLGCEFQLLDDKGHRNGRNPLTSAGALYGLFPPDKAKKLQPLDRFNTSRIIVHNNHIQHWLNDIKIIEVQIGSEQWNQRVKRSKFSDKPGFGANQAGRVMLQDHGSDVWFRQIELRMLSDAQ